MMEINERVAALKPTIECIVEEIINKLRKDLEKK